MDGANTWTRSEFGGAVWGSEDVAPVEELAARFVEVVGVVFMGEKDGVDGRKKREGESGGFGGAQGHTIEVPGVSG